MSTPDFQAEVWSLRLERVLDASVDIIAEEGWDRLSMVAVARRSGVPRQGLYRLVGDRAALGRALVDREVDRVLAWVREGVEAHPGSLQDAVAAAARSVLQHGRESPLLLAVLQPSDDSGLLALVTLDPEVVLGQATTTVRSLLGEVASEGLVDSMVRLTISHVVQPTVGIDDAVDRITRVMRGFL